MTLPNSRGNFNADVWDIVNLENYVVKFAPRTCPMFNFKLSYCNLFLWKFYV